MVVLTLIDGLGQSMLLERDAVRGDAQRSRLSAWLRRCWIRHRLASRGLLNDVGGWSRLRCRGVRASPQWVACYIVRGCLCILELSVEEALGMEWSGHRQWVSACSKDNEGMRPRSLMLWSDDEV